MDEIEFDNAYFINLGLHKQFVESSINEGIIQAGWQDIPKKILLQRNWDLITKSHAENYPQYENGARTRDINALKIFLDSSENDLWITRYYQKSSPSQQFLYWCRMNNGEIQYSSDDEDPPFIYRMTKDGWSKQDIHGKILRVTGSHLDKSLGINGHFHEISKTMAFKGTLCRVKETGHFSAI